MTDRLAEARAFVKNRPDRRKQCHVCRLPSEDRKIAEQLLADGTEASIVALWIQSVGHGVKEGSVRAHRRDNHVARG